MVKSIVLFLAALGITPISAVLYKDVPEYQKKQIKEEESSIKENYYDLDSTEKINEEENGQKENEVQNSIKKYFFLSLTGNILVVLFYIFLYRENTVLQNIKTISILAFLWIAAYYDRKFYIIPNCIIKAALLTRAVICVFEFIFIKESIYTILNEIIIAVIVFGICMICNLLIKNALGMGDVKLLFVMALFLGSARFLSAIFMVLLVTFLFSLYLLCRGKKGRKDIIPFAPSILIGTYLAAVLMGI